MKKIILIMFAFVVISCAEQKYTSNDLRQLSKIQEIQKIIQEVYFGDADTSSNKLYDEAIKGMVEGLKDPYSEYLTKEEYKDFVDSIQGEFSGIGIVMEKKPQSYIEVISTFIGGPSEKAGIVSGDKIIEIEKESVLDLTSSQVAKRLRGTRGTSVNVTVLKKVNNKLVEVKLVRDVIKVESVSYKMLNNQIGYLKLTEFDEGTGKKVEEAIQNLKKQGMKKLIFDLRSNPGGSLDEAVYISSLFIKDKVIVYTVDNKNQKYEYTRTAKNLGDFPLVLLVNEGSASASEVVTSALKDAERAKIIGIKTFGKGVVQRLLPMKDGSALKITISKYATAKNDHIHKNGIEPDIRIPMNILLVTRTYPNTTKTEETRDKEKIREVLVDTLGKQEADKLIEAGDVQLKAAIDVLNGKVVKSIPEEVKDQGK